MRRLTVAFVILFAASVLAACGDAGDHFGEFRQAPPPPQSPTSIQAQMPIVPGTAVRSAKLPLYVTAYVGNQALAQGTSLVNPIVITTNYVGYVTFSSPTGPAGKKYKSLNLASTPNNITVYYTKPPVKVCTSAPPVVIQVYNHDAKPQFVSVNLSGCGSGTGSPTPSPTPSTKPTKSPKPTPTPSPTPAPVQPTVKKLSLRMPATPNPLNPGTFSLVVTAFGSNGKAFSTGTTLTNPIQLTSNSSCSIQFSFNNQTASGLTIPTAPGVVGVVYTPPSATCTPPSTIIITAFDLDASPQTANFSLLGGTATVASLTMTMLQNPDPTSAGVYPVFITAKDSTGATIPYGESLTNPIQLSSNASCATGFGLTSNPGAFNSTIQISSTQTQVYMQFLGGNASCKTPPANVILTAISAGGVSTTYTFPY